jgi:hypothetical protein
MHTNLQLVDNAARSKAPSKDAPRELLARGPRQPAHSKSTNVRTQTLAAINATWRKLCPLEGEELRNARLAFATKALNLKGQLKSLSKCSPKQLGRIIDAMRLLEKQPVLSSQFSVVSAEAQSSKLKTETENSAAEGEVTHLATSAQGAAIERLRNYLGWSAIGLQNFIIDKFNRKHSPALLTPAEANSCTMILMTIGARKRIVDRRRRESGDGSQGKISRVMIHAEIPALKRELCIDQKPFTAEDTEDDDHN